jgi:hypothetical protein
MRSVIVVALACVTVGVPPVLASDDAVRAGNSGRQAVFARESSPGGTTSSLSQSRGRGAVKKAARGKKSAREYREVLLPAGTSLSLELRTRLASDTSRVEEIVRAKLLEAVRINGETVLPSGTQVVGYVTDVERPGRVKGRARVALRFTTLRQGGDEYEIRTREIERLADSTRAQDAAKVGIGAGAGAVLGAIVDGGSGAATGAAIGAAAGTGAALATRGEDVRLEIGEMLETQLTAPLPVLVRVR